MCLGQEIKPYPTQPQKPSSPQQGNSIFSLLIQIGIIVFVLLFIVIILGAIVFIAFFIARMFIKVRTPPLDEQIYKERVKLSKQWNGTELYRVMLSGDEKIPSHAVGYCNGFLPEKEFDYIHVHSGLPGWFWFIKKIKGENAQLEIPLLNISIPEGRLIQVEPHLHSAPGRTIMLYGSGLYRAGKYWALNTSNIPRSKRIDSETADILDRCVGSWLGRFQQYSETLWEMGKEHHRRKEFESGKAEIKG